MSFLPEDPDDPREGPSFPKRTRKDAQPRSSSSIEETDEPILLEMPAKILNTGMYQNMDKIPVYINGFPINLDHAIPIVYKHELIFEATYKKSGRTVKLAKASKIAISNNLRFGTLFELCQIMINAYNVDFFIQSSDDKHKFVYDCGINFYSSVKLLEANQEKKFLINFKTLQDKYLDYLGGNRIETVEATLLATIEIDLQSTEAVDERLDERNREVVQFLEILSNQKLYHNEKYFIFAQKMFEKDSKIRLHKDPHVIKSGMAKSSRFIGNSLEDAIAMVQIDPKKSAFYDDIPVIRYLCERFRCRDDELTTILRESRSKARQAAQILKDIIAITQHLAHNIYFNIHNLTEEGADGLFLTKDGEQISITKYYETKHHTRLKYSELPCAIERRFVNGKEIRNYYPLEVLKIQEGQIVPRNKMSKELSEQMIQKCQMKPYDYIHECKDQLRKAENGNENEAFQAFGIRVVTELIETKADVLFPPSIEYADRDYVELPVIKARDITDVEWKVKEKSKFAVGCENPRKWAVLRFQKCLSNADGDTFVKRYIKFAQDRGMGLDQPESYDDCDYTDLENVTKKFKEFQEKGITFVLFFSEDDTHPVHHYVKLQEILVGITTQHIVAWTVLKILGKKGNLGFPMQNKVLENLVEKTNLKLGGLNYHLRASDLFRRKNDAENLVREVWLKSNRMFIGIDMSFAAPQSLHDRQKELKTIEPTVIGSAHTISHPTDMRGDIWYQEPRVTIIQTLTEKIETFLERYYKARKRYPEHVIIYRMGVSEGELTKVMSKERLMITKAFMNVSLHEVGYNPKLTIIVAQATSNYRVLTQNFSRHDNALRQNVPPGTVVDDGVLHPTQTEFLLIAQRAFQGTAHPIKFTVVYDSGERMPLEEIEYTTYCLCYAHSIVTSPISIPAPLFSAGDLAKRGRNNWKTIYFGDGFESTAITSASTSINYTAEEKREHYTNISLTLHPTIDTKFWA